MAWCPKRDLEMDDSTIMRSKKKRNRKVYVTVYRLITRIQKVAVELPKSDGNSSHPPNRSTRKHKNLEIEMRGLL